MKKIARQNREKENIKKRGGGGGEEERMEKKGGKGKQEGIRRGERERVKQMTKKKWKKKA